MARIYNDLKNFRNSEHGQRRTRHERLPVLHLHRRHALAGRETRRLRKGRRRVGRSQENRNLWVEKRKNEQEDSR